MEDLREGITFGGEWGNDEEGLLAVFVFVGFEDLSAALFEGGEDDEVADGLLGTIAKGSLLQGTGGQGKKRGFLWTSGREDPVKVSPPAPAAEATAAGAPGVGSSSTELAWAGDAVLWSSGWWVAVESVSWRRCCKPV